MDPKTDQTKMTNPPTSELKMAAPEAAAPAEKPKKDEAKKEEPPKGRVKMRAIRACSISKPGEMDDTFEPGQEFFATEEQAAELSKPIAGTFSFFGSRNEDVARHQIRRAERIG